MRLEGIPALKLWNQMLEMLKPGSTKYPKIADFFKVQDEIMRRYHAITLKDVDYVPPSMPLCNNASKLYMIEDNDSVIKMLMKGRAPILKHCARTHHVDLGFLFEKLK